MSVVKLRIQGLVSFALGALLMAPLGIPLAKAGGAESAADSGRIEEVVVTAERREENLQNVALSVSAVSAEALAVRGVNGLADLQPGSIPGVFFGQFAGTPSVLAINMRGVGTPDPTQGTTELPVPVYIDGVYLGRGQGLGLDLIEPERVEVLRGPQGQLFGRNAEGGVVQYVSRKPSGNFGVKASISAGNYSDQRYRASVDLPSIGGLALQLSGAKSKHDAYTPQTGPSIYSSQTGYSSLDSSGGRFAARWKNDSGVTVDYTYDNTEDTDSQESAGWTPIGIPVNPLFQAINPYNPSYPSSEPVPVYNTPFKVKASGHALTIAWAASDHSTLRSISSYRETSRHGGSTLAPNLPAGLTATPTFNNFAFLYPYAGEDLGQHQASEELQFVGGWSRFDLTAGAMYFKEGVADGRTTLLTGPAFQNPLPVFAPPGVAFCAQLHFDPCEVGQNLQKSQTKSWGLYSQGTWRPDGLDDKLELTAGLRYTNDKKEALRYFSLVQGGPVNKPANFSASRVDPAFTVRYKWSDSTNTYLRYARGYRAGGANVRSSSFASFGAEVNEAWELGLKSQFADRHVQLNAALFFNTIKGEQLAIQEAPTVDPSLTNTINARRDKKVKGIEAELSWRATTDLTLGLNYAYMDADKFYDVANPYGGGALSRFYQIYTPENSGSVFGDYSHKLTRGALFLHADYAYTSDFWNTPGAIPVASIAPGRFRPPSGSSQLAARIGWKDIVLGSGNLTFSVWGKNLGNNAANIYGFDGCGLGTAFCVNHAAPRTYGAEVRYQH